MKHLLAWIACVWAGVLSAAANAPGKAKAPAAALSGRSNVVDRRSMDQAIEDIQAGTEGVTKVLIDGQIFILRGEKIYTLTGQELR